MIVLDASVVVKLLTREPGSDAAFARVAVETDRVAPDFYLIEIAGALSKKVRYAGLDRGTALAAWQAAPAIVTETYDTAGLVAPALDLSITIAHAMYDCFYLALAEQLDCVLLTSDEKFVAKAGDAGHAHRIEVLPSDPTQEPS